MNFKPVMIKLSELEEHPLNPNVEDPNVFTNLVKEIEQDGFSEPITVAKNEKTGKYVVVSGNHRLKAAKVLCYDELPCIVQDWDEETQKIKIVRRNLLKGELDSTKFSKLVDSLENNYSPEELSKAMGFVSEDDFSRLYNLEQEMASRTAGAIAAQEAASSETAAIDGLSLLLNQLFSQYGATLVHSFMNFMYGKKLHTMLLMNTSLKKSLEKLALISSKHGLDMNELLSATIVEGSKTLDIDKTPDLAKIESLRDVEEDYEYKHVDELEE